jgi:hypothetical protein
MKKALLLLFCLFCSDAIAQNAAMPLRAIAPKFPAISLAEHASETISVRVKIDVNGQVTEAEVISGVNFYLKQTSEDAAKLWIFTKSATPTRVVTLEFEYEVLKNQLNADADVFFEPPFRVIIKKHPLESYGGDWTKPKS